MYFSGLDPPDTVKPANATITSTSLFMSSCNMFFVYSTFHSCVSMTPFLCFLLVITYDGYDKYHTYDSKYVVFTTKR